MISKLKVKKIIYLQPSPELHTHTRVQVPLDHFLHGRTTVGQPVLHRVEQDVPGDTQNHSPCSETFATASVT